MRDRSLPGKVEFELNSEFIPCLVLVLFGQKCTPIAKILLLMTRSAVSVLVVRTLYHTKENIFAKMSYNLLALLPPPSAFCYPPFPLFSSMTHAIFSGYTEPRHSFANVQLCSRHFSLRFWLGQGKSDSECNVDLCSVKHR